MAQRIKKLAKVAAAAAAISVMLSIMPVVNYNVDPGGLFRKNVDGSLEARAVEIMMDGHSAEGLVNYDERLVKRLCIYKKGQVDTIVLGSSRGALISEDMVNADSFFNLSVTGAALRDIIGMYGVYREQGYTAKRVIIALDPWVLNSKYDSRRFESVLADGYCYCLREIMGRAPEAIAESGYVLPLYRRETDDVTLFDYPVRYLKELFSVPYFQSSLKLIAEGRADVELRATDEKWTVLGSLRPDGSYCYPEDYRNAGYEEVTALAAAQLYGDTSTIMGCEDMEFDDPNRQLFLDFIKALTDEGVDVDLVMIPLNPVLYDYMKRYDRFAPVMGAADYIRECARECGCDVVGDFDPNALGAFAVDFYDGYHYRAEFVAQLIEQLEG